ncbi:MAG: hypothetical protein QM783_04410 [Phycisphaerales bacterium]
MSQLPPMSNMPASNAPRPADGLAIASMICGIVGLAGFCFKGCGIPFAIAGLICGLMSKTPGGIRTAGLICSSIAIALCLVAIVLAIFFGIVILGAAAGGAAAGSHP